MPRFKNRQGYEEWKTRRLEEGMERAKRKKSIEKLMPHCSQSRVKEVPEPKPFTEQLLASFHIHLKAMVYTCLLWVLYFSGFMVLSPLWE